MIRLGYLVAAMLVGAAAVHPAAAEDWSAVHGVDSDGYVAWFQRVTGEGYRPIYVNGYDVGGRANFAAVAIKDESPPEAWRARHNLTGEQYQAAFNEFSGAGYRPICVSGYRDGEVTRFAAIWIRDGQRLDWDARNDLTSEQYSERVAETSKRGLRPDVITTYSDGSGGYKINVLFVPSEGAAWRARHDLTDKQYQQLFDELGPQGYVPVSISACGTSAGVRYAAVFVKADYGWRARSELLPDGYVAAFNQYKSEGFRPSAIVGYLSDFNADGLNYAALFTKK